MGAIDAFTPAKAAGAGVALSAVNPKNLLFVVGAAATDAQADVAAKEQALVCRRRRMTGVVVPLVVEHGCPGLPAAAHRPWRIAEHHQLLALI